MYSLAYPCRVGIDKLILAPCIEEIDLDRFNKALQSDSKSDSPNITLTRAVAEQTALPFFPSHLFGLIGKITIRHFESLLSLSLDQSRKPKYRLTLFLPPLSAKNGMDLLGNIYNHRVVAAQKHAETIMKSITAKYGIVFKYETLEICQIEININFVLPETTNPDKVINFFIPLQSVYSSYRVSGTNTRKKHVMLSPKHQETTQITVPANTLLSLPEKEPRIRIYDKSHETLSQQNHRNAQRIITMDKIIRIEYIFYNSRQIFPYFKTTDLNALSQKHIELAFQAFTREHIKKPLRTFENELTLALEHFFSKLDIRQERNWRSSFLNTLFCLLSKYGVPYYCFTQADICHYTACINGKSVQHNRSRTINSIVKLINSNGGETLEVTSNSKKPVEILVDLLCDFTGSSKQLLHYDLS